MNSSNFSGILGPKLRTCWCYIRKRSVHTKRTTYVVGFRVYTTVEQSLGLRVVRTKSPLLSMFTVQERTQKTCFFRVFRLSFRGGSGQETINAANFRVKSGIVPSLSHPLVNTAGAKLDLSRSPISF